MHAPAGARVRGCMLALVTTARTVVMVIMTHSRSFNCDFTSVTHHLMCAVLVLSFDDRLLRALYVPLYHCTRL